MTLLKKTLTDYLYLKPCRVCSPDHKGPIICLRIESLKCRFYSRARQGGLKERRCAEFRFEKKEPLESEKRKS